MYFSVNTSYKKNMKKNKLLITSFFLILILSCSFFVNAADTIITENENTTETEYVSRAPWTYGEMKDGLFVRRLLEELSWISPDDPDYKKEWKICEEMRYLEEMTPEMKALGYRLDKDGYLIYPEDDGEASIGEKAIKVEGSKADKNATLTGQVTFNCAVDADIHETCFIQMINDTTKQVYLIELYEVNNFSRTVEFPEGEYIILGGGVYKDTINKYPLSCENFTVKNGSSTFLAVQIGYPDTIATTTTEDIEIQETTKTETIVVEQKNDNSLLPAVLRLISIFVIVILGVFIYKKIKK